MKIKLLNITQRDYFMSKFEYCILLNECVNYLKQNEKEININFFSKAENLIENKTFSRKIKRKKIDGREEIIDSKDMIIFHK